MDTRWEDSEVKGTLSSGGWGECRWMGKRKQEAAISDLSVQSLAPLPSRSFPLRSFPRAKVDRDGGFDRVADTHLDVFQPVCRF